MHPDGMGWSWTQLQETPQYVRAYCWDFLRRQRAAAIERGERAARERKAAERGRTRIPR